MTYFPFYDRMKAVMKMNIYLIRHAQTEHNKKGRVFSGKSDISISEEGERQAEKCRNFPFISKTEAVYISPLKRTKETADIIFPKNIPRYVIPEFAEMDFGEYEGKVLEENTKDEIFLKWLHNPEGLVFPGGDSLREHAEEAVSALKKIVRESDAENIAIVSHRTTIRLIVTLLMKKELSSFREQDCDNCAMIKIRYENNGFFVDEMNVKA